MRYSTSAALVAAAGLAAAQRPSNTSICDYYTTALLKNNTAENQYKLLQLVVNTAVIGNYTQPNVGVMVPGILAANQTYNGEPVNLVPYFDGGLKSSNRGDPTAVNFLDGGGATPLMNTSLPTQGSNEYTLLTHLYSYFGALLGCTTYGMSGFPSYAGQSSQYNVHRYMDLTENQVGYFIQQVGLSAASFGVTKEDVTAVGDELTKVFNYKCAAAATVIPAQGAQLQSICVNSTCPMAPNGTCSAYPDGGAASLPEVANATLAMGEGTTSSMSGSSSSMMSGSSSMSSTMSGSMTSTMSGSMSSTASPSAMAGGASQQQVMGLGAAAAGGLALAFAL